MSAIDFLRVNFILPRRVYQALKSLIPERQRSKVVTRLLEQEIERRKKDLYKAARAVENDKALRQEMQDWDATLQDGLEESEWK